MTGSAFLLLALTLVVAAGNWVAVERGQRALEYVCKPLTMVLLIATTLALDVSDTTARAWFVAALVFCLAGDVFLMLPQDRFVPGVAAFLVGHLLYVVGMVVLGVDAGRVAVGVLVVLVAVALLGRRILRAVGATEPALAGPVGAYVAVISAMVATAIGTGHVAAIAGAASFYGSDALIAWTRFIRVVPHQRIIIMVTYHLGQIGLVLSLL